MFRKIKKRDGRVVKFNSEKIISAIAKAGVITGEFDGGIAQKLTLRVVNLAQQVINHRVPTVEEIQDIVEDVLIASPYKKTAKAYIIYRDQHTKIREITANANVNLVDQYLKKLDWQVSENSNMTYSLQGLNNYVSSEISKIYWLNKIYPPEIRQAHTGGDFHIHDLNLLSVYCVGWDLYDLLVTGFRGVPGKVESKPAKHFRSALGQVVNFFYTLQGEAAGAQAFSNFDTLLAPFIRYDNLNFEKVKQGLQEFVFNINVPTRVGFQSLAYDIPVVVRRNGDVLVEPIGRLVESEIGRNRDRVLRNTDGYGNPSPDSLMVLPRSDYRALGFDEKGELAWLRMRGLVKHRVRANGFKRIRTGAGEVRVSPAHSLFRLNGKGPEPITPIRLKTARRNSKLNHHNHLLAVRRLNGNIFGSEERVDLVKLALQLPPSVKRNLFVKSQANSLMALKKKLKRHYGSMKQLVYDQGRHDKSTLYDHLRRGCLPLDLWTLWTDNFDEELILYLKPYPQRSYPRYLEGESLRAFVELAAWFITEGKVNGSNIIIAQEKGKEEGIRKILDKLGLSYRSYRTKGWSSSQRKKTETEVVNFEIAGLYAYLLPYIAGATSSEKKIPSFIFDLSLDYRKQFLETLIRGDGTFEKSRITFSSKSDKLVTGVSLISISLGYKISVTRKDPRTGVNLLLIYPEPKKKLGPSFGDLFGVPVYEIEDCEYEGEWEYDISVEVETENFIGGQGLLVFHNTPFTNITLDLTPPSYYADQGVVVGGKIRNETYQEFQEEMDLLNKAFFEVMTEGDAQGRVFTFPIPTYNITKDLAWDNKNLNGLWAMAAKYGIPYFSNFINSDMDPEDARSMCCRLRLDTRKLGKRGGGLFGSSPLTGSIGVVTINMARLGYLSREESDFLMRLEGLMTIAKDSLEIKRKILERFTESDLYPYSRFYLRNVKKRFGQYWKNHFSTIGLLGMNEACLNLLGANLGSEKAIDFTMQVLEFMRQKLIDFQKETGNNYNLEATPAEGTSYRLAKKDKVKFPDMICANEKEFKKGAEPFYTNSTQLQVNYTDDLFETLDLQDKIQTRYTGGTVLHIFLGERVRSSQTVKRLVKKICDKYRLPYFTFTPTFSVCPSHGYLVGEKQKCPKCGSRCEVYSRSVGYLRPVSQWNAGKKAEFQVRKTYKIKRA